MPKPFSVERPFEVRGRTLELRKADWDEVARRAGEADAFQFARLRSEDAPRLAALGFDQLRGMSLRELESADLRWLEHFPGLRYLEIWQSPKVRSLAGLETARGLRWLNLWDLGRVEDLGPLGELTELEVLHWSGGVWKAAVAAERLAPLAKLDLRGLVVGNVAGIRDVGALLGYRRLEVLWAPTAMLPVGEVARLAAAYPWWAKEEPWVDRNRESNPACRQCGGGQVMLLLAKKKRYWCERCEGEKLAAALEEFRRRVRAV